MRINRIIILLAWASTLALGWGHGDHQHEHGEAHDDSKPLYAIAVPGDSVVDQKIREHQARLRSRPNSAALIENLGWLFVAKARMESDHAPYGNAMRCARLLQETSGSTHRAQLLQAHIHLQEHRFAEAKRLGQQLVKERGWHYDHGLLGDTLLDLGDTPGAIAAYQEMMKQRPGLESFARAALARWQVGQLDGAIEAMEMAVSAGSQRSPEPLAWAYVKLGGYYLQIGEHSRVEELVTEALRLVPGHPKAQRLLGCSLMAQGHCQRARGYLEKAAATVPEPAFLWALRDCLKELGDSERTEAVEAELHRTGAGLDCRTYALFLATTGQRLPEAVRPLALG